MTHKNQYTSVAEATCGATGRGSQIIQMFNWTDDVMQVFRTDLITAMKVHDSYQLNPEDYYVLADPWRQEWEKGVQVPVSPQSIPQPVAR